MAAQFTREHLKICVAKMCLTIGWHTSMTTPIEILTDVLCNYLFQLGKSSKDYANEFGRTDPNINDLALVFREFHINLGDLEEYVKYVDFAVQPHAVPKYPIPKEDHLNFLKPGSKEVVTRPVHIHEHLPPMYPLDEVDESDVSSINNNENNEDKTAENFNSVFKRPSEILQNENFKRPRLLLEDEGRPTREISSVMMTTSGFLSPAREGKLPESRTPICTLESTLSPPTVSPIPPENSLTKKPIKIMKVSEKKKEKIIKDTIKGSNDNGLVRKVTNIKDFIKNKMKIGSTTNNSSTGNFTLVNDINVSLISSNKGNSPHKLKFNKALAAARLKTEKLNTTITPIIPKLSLMQMNKQIKIEPHVDKLLTEPDKKKINIFKKISVKNEKLEKNIKIKTEIKQESRESSPDLVIDESVSEINNKVHHLSNDITIELINSTPSTKSPEKIEQSYFDDDSPPGTPSTPKTPEMISQSPPLKAEKQKRKDKSKVKKFQRPISPPRIVTESEDYVDVINVMEDNMERPKTPEAELVLPQEDKRDLSPKRLPFFRGIPGPGLIPSTLGNPLFPHLPIPTLGIPAFGQPPFIPPGLPLHLIPSLKSEDLVSRLSNIPPTINSTVPNIPALPPAPVQARIPVPPRVRTPISVPVPIPPITLPVMSTPSQTSVPLTIPADAMSSVVSSTVPSPCSSPGPSCSSMYLPRVEKKSKEHKKDKKDKTKKKNKKDKLKYKAEKKKLKEERKDKFKKEKKERKKDKGIRNSEGAVPKLTLKIGCSSPLVDTCETRKIHIKPIIKKDEPSTSLECSREMSPELAKISALVTGQPKLKITSTTTSISTHATDPYPTSSNDSFNMKKIYKPIVLTKQRKETYKESTSAVLTNSNTASSSYIDAEGNKVWICPACGKQDDGSPMIGCDDCDAWYHWVCVGIQVPPDDSEDWYCRLCISKKQEVLQSDKKKKRKRRDKKDH